MDGSIFQKSRQKKSTTAISAVKFALRALLLGALLFSTVSCGSPSNPMSGEEIEEEIEPTKTEFTGKHNANNLTLTIIEKQTGRAVFNAKNGYNYLMKVNNKLSSGSVLDVEITETTTKFTLKPFINDSPFFTVVISLSSNRINNVTGTITFDNEKDVPWVGPGKVNNGLTGGGGKVNNGQTGGGGKVNNGQTGGGGGGDDDDDVLNLPLLSSIIITSQPVKLEYKMGEEVDTTDLVIENVYDNGEQEETDDYYISGDTFTAGPASIKIVSLIDPSKTALFDIDVSNELIDTGLPVIYIDTEDAAPIVSKDDYLKMKMKVVSNDPSHPEWDIDKTNYKDQIKGRGNTTWQNPKKPYRIKFDKKTSMFGLTASKNWVLLADYQVPTLLANTVAFELVQRFDGPLFKNHFVYVDVVLNGQYNGTYILTEHMRVGEGRVEIDENNDYLVEIDDYFDEDPKFRTNNLKLPIMITSPEYGADINDVRYQFVINSLNKLDGALSDSDFPNNNWKDIIDRHSLVDYMLINEICLNYEFHDWRIANNVFMYYKATENIIKMSHVWDFDFSGMVFGNLGMVEPPLPWLPTSSPPLNNGGALFKRFHKDNDFEESYRKRWDEKYDIINSMPDFIRSTAEYIRKSHSLNNRRWFGGAYHDFDRRVNDLINWYEERVAFLDRVIGKQ